MKCSRNVTDMSNFLIEFFFTVKAVLFVRENLDPMGKQTNLAFR